MRSIFKVTDSTGFIRYYIIAEDFIKAEEDLIGFDALFLDYKIELLPQEEMIWITENVSQNLYIFEVEYIDQTIYMPDTMKLLVSASTVGIASVLVQNNIGPSFNKIISIERQTVMLINNVRIT